MINELVITCPFAWYKAENYQERFTKGCADGGVPYLHAPSDRLLPFQIRLPKTSTPLRLTRLYLAVNCTTSVLDLTTNLADIELVTTDPFNDWLVYKGEAQMEFINGTGGVVPLDIPPGIYNAVLETTRGTYYSELFSARRANDLAGLFKIEWWSTVDFGGAVYATGYKNRLYLDCELLPPSVEIEQDEEKNGYGVSVPVLQRFIDKYKLVAPDCMHAVAKALCTIPMHPENSLVLPDGRSTKMELVKPEPSFFHCGADVALTFQESVIIKTACAD